MPHPPVRPNRLRLALLAAVVAGLAPHCGNQTNGPGPNPTPGSVGVLVGAGDIAQCGSAGTAGTAALLDNMFGTVFTAGDNAYFNGADFDFRDCYNPTWGRQKFRTFPVPGNHDYGVPNAIGYFNYFGSAAAPAGQSYYRYSVGPWNVYSINSEIDIRASSPQVSWLKADLAANPTKCSAAILHRPLFTSGPNGNNPDTKDLWQVFYDNNIDVVITGHDHIYERFAPQDPNGRLDAARGIREFIVGTGGADLYKLGTTSPNSEVRNVLFGVLSLTLFTDSYQWQFVPAQQGNSASLQNFTDVGSANCH